MPVQISRSFAPKSAWSTDRTRRSTAAGMSAAAFLRKVKEYPKKFAIAVIWPLQSAAKTAFEKGLPANRGRLFACAFFRRDIPAPKRHPSSCLRKLYRTRSSSRCRVRLLLFIKSIDNVLKMPRPYGEICHNCGFGRIPIVGISPDQ
jgi:hypothetical protein